MANETDHYASRREVHDFQKEKLLEIKSHAMQFEDYHAMMQECFEYDYKNKRFYYAPIMKDRNDHGDIIRAFERIDKQFEMIRRMLEW
jgi:hypothetical protein